MIESTHRLSIFERVVNLSQNHDCQSSYTALRMYLGSSEYNELRMDVSLQLPTIQGYEQGTCQFMGKSIFVLKDVPFHLALA